jgi:hypothetical protein
MCADRVVLNAFLVTPACSSSLILSFCVLARVSWCARLCIHAMPVCERMHIRVHGSTRLMFAFFNHSSGIVQILHTDLAAVVGGAA